MAVVESGSASQWRSTPLSTLAVAWLGGETGTLAGATASLSDRHESEGRQGRGLAHPHAQQTCSLLRMRPWRRQR